MTATNSRTDPSDQVFGHNLARRRRLTLQLDIRRPNDPLVPQQVVFPRGGGPAPFQDSVVDRFETRTHNDQTRGDDADVHFDNGDGQRGDVRP